MILEASWDNPLDTLFLLGSHNFMVTALGSCVNSALHNSICRTHPRSKTIDTKLTPSGRKYKTRSKKEYKTKSLLGKNRLLVRDEPVEFMK